MTAPPELQNISDTWAAHVERHEHGPEAERAPGMAAVVLAAHPLFVPLDLPPHPSLPQGQPSPTLVRRAGSLLIDLAPALPAPEGCVCAILGRTARWHRPRGGHSGDLSEHHAELADLLDARELTFDPVLEMIVLRALSNRQRDLFQLRESCETAEALARVAAASEDLTTSALHETFPGLSWLPAAGGLAGRFLVTAYMRQAVALRQERDYDAAIAARRRQVDAARRLSPAQPFRVADAHGQLAAVLRSIGRVVEAAEVLEEQRRDAGTEPGHRVSSVLARSAGSQALFLRQWDQERHHLESRLDLDLRSLGARPNYPAELPSAIERLHALDQEHLLRSVGNVCYELGRNLIDSGSVRTSADARAEARQWLTNAVECWREFGFNGLIAVNHRRSVLDAIEALQTGDDSARLDLGRRMVTASREWRRPAGQRRAAIDAAVYGAAGDSEVRRRLEQLAVDAPAVDRAHLAGARALWSARRAHVLAARANDEAAREEWEAARELAHEAQDGLSVDIGGRTVLLHPERVIEAIQLQAECIAALAESASDTSVEIAKRLEALPAIAQLFAAAGTLGQRAVVAADYEPWLVETALAAATAASTTAATTAAATAGTTDEFIQDASTTAALDAVDKVVEVARRDLVGLMLREMGSDATAPAEIAAAARSLSLVYAATVGDAAESNGATEPSEPTQPTQSTEPPAGVSAVAGAAASPDSTRRSIASIGDGVSRALEVVDGVLGPIGREMVDPASIEHITAREIASRVRAPRAAVLSLWLIGTPGGDRLVRRLVIRSDDAEHRSVDTVDVVEVPSWLSALGEVRHVDDLFMLADSVAGLLLPTLLRDELLREANDIVHLTIVPTGLLGLPFASLPLTPTTLLVDVAVVSLVQSLQAAGALLDRPQDPAHLGTRPEKAGVAAATYDVAFLREAATELAAFKAAFPHAQELATLDQVRRRLVDSTIQGAPGVYALALHGMRGSDGWSQHKRLPSGEVLTVGHMLELYFPQLVVSASCNTDIRSDAGELGGFPLAFQLRGAVDIVGTLYDVHDAATAEIMSVFYGRIAHGQHAAEALRDSQREWIDVDRTRRLRQRDKWGLVVVYGVAGR